MKNMTSVDLAEAIVANGFCANESGLAHLLAEAREHGVNDLLLKLAADSSNPVVVRERALGKLIVHLESRRFAVAERELVPC